MGRAKYHKRNNFPAVVLFLGFVALVASGITHMIFPSQTSVSLGVLGASVLLILFSAIMQPSIIRSVLFSRKTFLWLNDAFFILAIIGIGVILSYIGFRRNIRYDFTRDKLYSISDATINIVRRLKKEVVVTAFFPLGKPEYAIIEDFLKEYQRHSDFFKFKMVDPMKDPVTAEAMKVRNYGLVVQCGSSRKDIFLEELFIMPPPMRASPDQKPKFQGEQMLTSALLNVTSGDKPVISFVTGHGEAGINSHDAAGYAAMNEYLSKENYEVRSISLLSEDIAADTSVLAIIAPKTDFEKSEIDKIDEFIENRHGHLLIALDPDSRSVSLLDFISRKFGVIANRETVIDPRGFQSGVWLVAPEYGDHDIVKPLIERNLLTLMFYCRGFSFEKRDRWQTTVLLRSVEAAYAKRNEDDVLNQRFYFDPDIDVRGPLNLALTLEETGVATGSRVVLFGNSHFASNSRFSQHGNLDLFINTVNWLVGQDELISIRPKVVDFGRIELDEESQNMVFFLSVLLSPAMILVLGTAVWLGRRRF